MLRICVLVVVVLLLVWYRAEEIRIFCFFFFKQKTAYEMRISDWSSDVCSSDLQRHAGARTAAHRDRRPALFQLAIELARAGEHQRHLRQGEIGRASCRERVCQYV